MEAFRATEVLTAVRENTNVRNIKGTVDLHFFESARSRRVQSANSGRSIFISVDCLRDPHKPLKHINHLAHSLISNPTA